MASNIIAIISTWLLGIISQGGYLGIFVGMTLESSFFPFPSEIVLIPAGSLAALGKLNFFLVIVFGILGSLTGAVFNYYLALILGRDSIDFFVSRYGKFLFIKRSTLKDIDSFFMKYGEITTFTGRLIPVVRQVISLPAGFARMNFKKFLLFTFLGAGIWTIFLTSVGYFIGKNYLFINGYLNIIIVMLSVLVLSYIIFLVRRKKNFRGRR